MTSKRKKPSLYEGWVSLERQIELRFKQQDCVLEKMPEDVAKLVVKNIVEQSLPQHIHERSNIDLNSEKEVRWMMEVICYGLSLPLSENETIRSCMTIYANWFKVILPPTDQSVHIPAVIREDPNRYACDMLVHLYRVFIPRKFEQNSETQKQMERHVVVCHQVLRLVETAAKHHAAALSAQTWDFILQFLLAVNDALLAPPTEGGNLSEQMAPRVLSVIFEVWLLSCHYSFPRPPLWRTFHDMCRNWRHHRVLVLQWQRVNLALTDRVLRNMYGSDFPHISGVDRNIVPADMTKECVSECWIRFLNLLGNPVDLCHPSLISSTPAFLDLAMAADAKDYDSSVKFFPCLRQLPDIFLQAMRGIAVLADAFLGLAPSPVALSQSRPPSPSQSTASGISASSSHVSASATTNNPQTTASSVHSAPGTVAADKSPQSQRKPKSVSASSLADKTKAAGKQGKHGSVQWSSTNVAGGATSTQTATNASLTAATPTTTPVTTFPDSNNVSGMTGDGWLSLDMIPSPSVLSSRPHGNSILHLLGHWLFEAAVAGVHLASPSKAGQAAQGPMYALISARSTNVDPISYELGRAEACGALVRIFTCSRPDFLPLYLARFYICLYYGLRIDKEKSPQVLATIVFYSANLLRVDLQGANVLVPRLLSAVELILGEEERNRLKIPDYMSHVQLRRASINLLLSMICLPLQYNNAHVKDLLPVLNDVEEQVTFISLKKRLCERLYHALCYEKDSTNTQMLLGGIQLLIEDMAFAEKNEIQQQDETSGLSNTASEVIPPVDTTSGLFNHTVSLICNRLLGEWKKCNDTALSAMEVLCGLSKVKLSQTNRAMCKRTVRWICDFICQQCTRPPRDHSRTLHSIIVAAFQCLSLWLVHHAYLLHDKECLHCILETIELGISGRKSQNKRSDQPVLKADKHATPASRRVKDAAEAVLSTVMDLAGAFPNPMGGLESQVKEETLLRSCSRVPDRTGNAADTIHFRYFGLQTGLILALLEEPLVGNREEPLPAVNMIVRGPFGRHAWSLQLRQRIHNEFGAVSSSSGTPERPVLPQTTPRSRGDGEDAGKHPSPKFFPDAVDKIGKTSADTVIPSLETLAKRESAEREEIDLLKTAIASMTSAERQISEKVAKEQNERPFPNPDTECKQPSAFHAYQTSRLFLLHIGFLPMFDRARIGCPEEVLTPAEASSDDSSTSPVKLPALFHIDSSTRHFYDQLDLLDALPVRTTDLAYVFWQRTGQYTVEEIMKNDWRKCPQLIRFLDGLGSQAGDQSEVREWSDSATEVKFIVCDRKVQLERCRSSSEIMSVVGSSVGSSGHSDLQSVTSGSSTGARSSTGLCEERLARVGVVWLEHFNDLTRFPGNELILPSSGTFPPHVVFIHPLRQKGLYRVHLSPSNVQGSWAFKAGPLVSGMVVSKRCLASFVRQTVVNIHRRHRLQDADVFQPPHVRRNQKIHDILSRSAQTHLDMPDLFTNLLHEPMAHLEPRF